MQSFTCCKCLQKVGGAIRGLFLHLKVVHVILSSTCTKLVCAESNCREIFWRGSSYKRHLEKSHLSRIAQIEGDDDMNECGSSHENQPEGNIDEDDPICGADNEDYFLGMLTVE